MTKRYLVASEGVCLCNSNEETVTYKRLEAESVVKHLHEQGIEAQVIEIQINK